MELKICITFALAIEKVVSIGPWCNGNTPVFGTVIQGSSPCGPTEKTPHFEEFFIGVNSKSQIHLNRTFLLDFKCYHWSFCVVY